MTRIDFTRFAKAAVAVRDLLDNAAYDELVDQLALACQDCSKHFDYDKFTRACYAAHGHWHAVNPWRDCVVYVPIERLAECIAGGTRGETKGKDWLLAHWRTYGKRLDAYVLQGKSPHSIGVRYGAEGNQYLSPHNSNPRKIAALLKEFAI